MPWKKIEPMEERIEFALKAMGTLNFRALCEEYGISAKTGYKWKERFLREGIRGMGSNRAGLRVMPSNWPKRKCVRLCV